MKRKLDIKLLVFLVITAAITAGMVRFLLRSENGQILGSIGLSIAVATTTMQLGAIWYFLSSLRTFKKALKIAYSLLALGILVFSVIQLQLLTPTFFLFTDNLFVLNLMIIVPYVLSSLLFYISMYVFARLLMVRSIWTQPLMVLGLSAVVAAIGVFVPHPELGLPESNLNIIMGGIAWCAAISFAAMLVAWRIRHVIGAVYKSAMTWVALALGMVAFVATHELIVKIYFPLSPYVDHTLALWPFAAVGLLMLKAGINFKDTGRQFVRLSGQASYVEIVVGAAGMVSNPAAIDKELDKLRGISAQRGEGQELSPADKATLVRLYLYIENYLLTKEPLQNFTKEGLRNGLPEYFLKDLGGGSQSQEPSPSPQQPPASSPTPA